MSRLFIYPTRYCSADGLGPLPPQPAQRQKSRPRSGGIKRPGIDGFNGQLRAGGLSGQLDAHRVARGDRAWAIVHGRSCTEEDRSVRDHPPDPSESLPTRDLSQPEIFSDQRTGPIWPLFPASPPILPLRPHKLFQKGGRGAPSGLRHRMLARDGFAYRTEPTAQESPNISIWSASPMLRDGREKENSTIVPESTTDRISS